MDPRLAQGVQICSVVPVRQFRFLQKVQANRYYMTTPKKISLSILKEITNGFSQDLQIGRGGFADVYKGVYNGREIAVKLLRVDMVQGLNDQQFENEVGNLSRAKHQNIVQLVGYCYEISKEYVDHNGAHNFREKIYRAICFDYMKDGSLKERLYDQSFAPDWSTRYNIIKGICEGLNFLHKCVPPILHLDLKPANILLDSFMEPKVADFGLSRLFTQSQTQETEKIVGTWKYMPPEYLRKGKFSPKNDVFSLGIVMIEIMTAPARDSNSVEVGNVDVSQLTQQVLTKWGTAITEDTSKYPSDEIQQVEACIEVAIRCVDSERDKRPSVADIIDTLNTTETHMPKRVKRQLADELPFPIGSPRNTDNTPKTLIDELEHKHCNSIPRDCFNNNVQQATDSRETTSMEPELIIGRTEEKQKIMDTLSGSSTSKLTILPVYGIGGIGKTTLAQLIYNDSQFADHFQAWVYVSQNLDLNKIGNSIISQLSEVDSRVTEMQIIHKRLSKLLAGKKILIVLDDMWEKSKKKVESLSNMLRLGVDSTVKVIVTTRDEAIAKEICKNVEPYKLEPFTREICWEIIKQKSAFERRVDKKQLEQIGKDIAIKCGGVALAAQSLGYMLKRMDYDKWKSVRDSDIWNQSTSHGSSSENHEVLASLLLSYIHMPGWLRLCFSYCAVFPKGHLIEKYGLIHQWIALGFPEQSSKLDPMQLCEEYITQLLELSFLQNKTRHFSSDQWQDSGVTFFTMHDLVHDLARDRLAHQVNDFKGNRVAGDKCRYALLTDCSKPLQLSVTSPSNIKALRFVDLGNLNLHLKHCGDAFSPAIRLRVLDLSECLTLELPDSIGQLKQLRFLCAPRIQMNSIPECITELPELSYLNLRGSCISALPESIGDMKGMLHLDLSSCIQISELPRSFAELKQLVHLDLSRCHVSITEAFGGFTKLQYLNLNSLHLSHRHDRTGLYKVIGNLKKLRYLNLSRCMDYIAPSEDQIVPSEQMVSLLVSVSTLTDLEHLNLSSNKFISILPESFGDLKKLHTLNISACYNITKLPDSLVNMVSLKFLHHYNGLNTSALSLPNVVSLPHFVVHASSSDNCSSNIIKLQHTNPDELFIDKLENVKSAEEAWSIKLTEKQSIEILGFKWTPSAERIVDDKEVLEKLVPPSSVWNFSISGYMSVNFPDWVMGIGKLLPNLSYIDLCDIPNCRKLPPLGQLPNLESLSLCRMEGLEEWNTEEGANEFLFPELFTLGISNCAKLRIKPCLPGAILFIEDCDNVLSSWEEIPSHGGASSSSLATRLCVSYSRLPLYQWRLLHHLPALCDLDICKCSDLTASREIIKRLSSLESFRLEIECMRKAEFPSWLVELTSLKKLVLICDLGWCCDGVMSVPDIIQQLTNLRELKIAGCPALKEWYESEENKMKLSHIERVDIDWNAEIDDDW